MPVNVDKTIWISRTGLGLIFFYCFLASIFYAYFAQIHVKLGFLPFPIFIGEMLLFICLVLLAGICKIDRPFDRRSTVLLCLYFGWVLTKALINYHYDGPLSFRNAALFYYPIFAVFAYGFYQKANISRKLLMSLSFLAAGILFFKLMFLWCWWTYVTLFVIAIWNTRSIKWRWVGWVFLAVIIFFGKEYLYKGNRAHFVSVLGAVVFLVSYFGALLAKRRNFFWLTILLLSLACFIGGFFFISNRNDISSVTSLKAMISTYQEFDKRYQEQQAQYVPEKVSVNLYNPKKFSTLFLTSSCATSQSATTQSASVHSGTASCRKNILNDIVSSRIRDGRALDLNENNIVFRFFVWRDMARELIEKRAWWGFSFGHPQRSRSLEVLHWAETEWGRDGWITPHNSFFHIIYRAGILGVVLIGILFFMVGRLVRDFFDMNSIEGGFLVGGLVYWMVLSNFFVILEFPYNAIIFWTLFGITCAYRESLQVKAIK